MRVTVVVENLYEHGANRVTVDRAIRWQSAGDDVTLLSLFHVEPARRLAVPEELRVCYATTEQQRFRTALPVAFLRLILATRASDVLVSGTEIGLGAVLGWIAARVTRRRFAITVQSDLVLALDNYVPPWLQAANRRAVLGSDLAVCVAPALAANLRGLGMPDERVVVAMNGVPAAQIRAAARRQPAMNSPGQPLTHATPTLVAMGRLEPQKGFDLLLRAHRLALDTGAPAHRVLILGEGPQRESLQALATELGVTDSITLAGFCADPFPVLARAAAFVLPSRWEGLPLCLAEALACGVPCVAFDCTTGPGDVLDGGRYGRLVPDGDVQGFATAVREHLLDTGPLRAKAREAATANLDIFDPALAAARHRSALHTLADHGKTAGRARRGARVAG